MAEVGWCKGRRRLQPASATKVKAQHILRALQSSMGALGRALGAVFTSSFHGHRPGCCYLNGGDVASMALMPPREDCTRRAIS
eukprot:3864315-Amphidinium_carterae.1